MKTKIKSGLFVAIVTLVIAGGFSVKAQQATYLVDGLTWNNSQNSFMSDGGYWGIHANFTYKVDGDTIISDTAYKVIKQNYPDANSLWSSIFYAREDSQKWFFRSVNDVGEVLLYDFSVGVGDTVSIYGSLFKISNHFNYYGNLSVRSIDSIMLENGEIRKRILFNNTEWTEWIEGIGDAKFSLDNTCLGSRLFIVNDYISDLLCIWQDDIKLYDNNIVPDCYDNRGNSLNEISLNNITLYPNPVKNKLFISLNEKIIELTLWDIYGKIVYSKTINSNNYELDCSALSSGVYFIKVANNKGIIYNERLIKQ